MSRTQLGLLVALVVTVALVAVAAAVTLGRDEDLATDAHVHFDPITTADEVAVAAMAGTHTWTPAQQQSPWDAMHAVSDRLTGKMAEAASSRPDPDPTPRQWGAWARSGDRIIGAAELVGGQDPVPADATSARRTVEVRQQVLHPGGLTTPLEKITIAVELELLGDEWKVSNFQYTSIGSGQ